MFLQNKYYRWYCALMERAKTNVGPSSIFERHHIVPRSLGGKDRKENYVYLTFREHFIAHWLLTKCVEDGNQRKMYFAFTMMSTIGPCNRKRIISSWQFSIARGYAHVAHKGYVWSDESRKKLSEKVKGRKFSKETRAKLSAKIKGIPLTEERRKKMRWFSPSSETRQKLSIALKGRKRPAEVIEKIRLSHLALNQRRREEGLGK